MKLKGFLTSAAVVFALFGASATASAADFSLRFDDATFYTGLGISTMTPGVNHADGVHSVPDDVVVFNGTNVDGTLAVPADGVVIKPETIPGQSSYSVTWRALTTFSGTFDSITGQIDLSGQLEQTVAQGTNTCTTGPLSVSLSTETREGGNSGVRFAGGLEGTGKLAGGWSGLPPTTDGVSCDRANLDCYAQASIANLSGYMALASAPESLTKGSSSFDRCNPPTGGPVAPFPSPNQLQFDSYKRWASSAYPYLASLELLGSKTVTGSLASTDAPGTPPPPYKPNPKSRIRLVPGGAIELRVGAPIVSAKLRLEKPAKSNKSPRILARPAGLNIGQAFGMKDRTAKVRFKMPSWAKLKDVRSLTAIVQYEGGHGVYRVGARATRH